MKILMFQKEKKRQHLKWPAELNEEMSVLDLEKTITITCPYNPAHQISVERIQVPTFTSQLGSIPLTLSIPSLSSLNTLNVLLQVHLVKCRVETLARRSQEENEEPMFREEDQESRFGLSWFLKNWLFTFRGVRDSLLAAHLGRGRGLAASESQQVKI